MIIKIDDNNITVEDIINKTFDKSIFDECEMIILKEFINIMQ